MVTFIAVYRGTTVSDAQIVAVTADRCLVADVSRRLLSEPNDAQDPVLSSLERGKRAALRLIKKEASLRQA